jgi:hypothetical protein
VGGDTTGALRLLGQALALRRAISHADGVAESLVAIGALRRRAGDFDAATVALEEALSLSRTQGRLHKAALAHAHLACIPGGDPKGALDACAKAGPAAETAPIRYLLWQATRDRTHLDHARRLVDFLLEHAPQESREAMIANVPLLRDVVAAARQRGLA